METKQRFPSTGSNRTGTGPRITQRTPAHGNGDEGSSAEMVLSLVNAGLATRVTDLLEKEEALYLRGSDLESLLQPDSILTAAAQGAARALPCTGCSFMLWDRSALRLTVTAAASVRPLDWDLLAGRDFPIGSIPLHRRALETGELLVIRREDPPSQMSEEDLTMAAVDRGKWAALVPMGARSGPTGLLVVTEMRSWERSPFTPPISQLCQSVAAYAARIIHQTRPLTTALRDLNELWELLYELADLIPLHPIDPLDSRPPPTLAREVREAIQNAQRDLAALAPHELYAPFANIKASVDLILRGERALDPTTQREVLEIIRHQCSRLLAFSQNLLSVSVLGLDQAGGRRRPIPLSAPIERALAFLETEDGRHSFSISLPALSPTVLADPEMLMTVLHNLLRNAIRRSPEGGTIRIDAKDTENGMVEVTVSDQGPSLPVEQTDRVLESPLGEAGSDAESFGVDAMALYIVRLLVGAMGGRVRFQSQPGKLTRFTFTVPKASQGG